MDFTDKIVLVTGASRGIGRACARMFAEHGARVAVHYHASRAAAETTLAALAGSGHLLVQADIANPAEVQAMVSTVIEQMGGLHVLVNNAGIYEKRPVAGLTYEGWLDTWNKNIQTNLLGAANAAFCAAQHMIAHGGGRIVNVSSRGAFRGEPDSPAYGAAKAGMNAMSQSLAKALAPYGIIVTAVAPGWVDTDMAAEHLAERADEMRAQSPLERIARPEEVAYTVLFLASEGVEFLTGAIVDINGASYLRT
ncbi:MAG: SDR family NAD(P)-dependent oxidoreductase [Chloroflexi bacterium]|nr:SDR family NAD(P)-dependent oxidoreductase [Chloroflexota bacterium]MDL1884989.1 SDR family oxidoreductase [Anaerolineae bacterium CFX8]